MIAHHDHPDLSRSAVKESLRRIAEEYGTEALQEMRKQTGVSGGSPSSLAKPMSSELSAKENLSLRVPDMQTTGNPRGTTSASGSLEQTELVYLDPKCPRIGATK
jgi:hypothetical protein